MVELRAGRREDKARIRTLWQMAFGDTEEFLDRFFQLYPCWEDILVLCEADRPEAMLVLMPTALTDRVGRRWGLPYVYALATDPACRGRGYARRLLSYADQVAQSQGAAGICTVPAQPSLHRFFAGAGYEEGFSTRVWTAAGVGEEGAWRPAEAGEYNAMRRRLLSGLPYLDYPDRLIALQRGVSQFSGAQLYLRTGGVPGCAAVERTEEGLVAKELLLPSGEQAALPGPGQLRGPAPWREGLGQVVPFGMVRWFSAGHPELKQGYLGLAFD